MEQAKQPTPYFIRRTVPVHKDVIKDVIDLNDFAVVDDQVHPLREYRVTTKRHRWLILISALAILLCAFFYSVTRVPLSEATVLIERKAPQILKVQDTRGESVDGGDYNNEFYKTQYEILKSRAMAERVIRDEGLQDHPLFGGKGDKPAGNKRDGAIEGLTNSVKGWVKDLLTGHACDERAGRFNVACDAPVERAHERRRDAALSRGLGKYLRPDSSLSRRLHGGAKIGADLSWPVERATASRDDRIS